MRDFSFRAIPVYQNKERHPWVYGSFKYLIANIVNPGATDTGRYERRHDKGIIIGNYGDETEVLCDTVGLFTGLTDKNGNRIYEGDILHVCEYDNELFASFSDEPNRFDFFTLDEIKGEKRKEYKSAVFWDEGGFVIGSSPDDKDVPLCCLFGDQRRSQPIFTFEIVGDVFHK